MPGVLGGLPDAALPFVYLVASVLFIHGLREMTHPRTAPRGNLISAAGMVIAVSGDIRVQKAYELTAEFFGDLRGDALDPGPLAVEVGRTGVVSGRTDQMTSHSLALFQRVGRR